MTMGGLVCWCGLEAVSVLVLVGLGVVLITVSVRAASRVSWELTCLIGCGLKIVIAGVRKN